ncbi:MAG: DUF302 domain-containing protein [Thiobacillus sp.]|uniref:DUF302 domain-containing protein n=1 Tax=Thiobacillus sp. TaxID=924 RepID=UPI002735AE4A|nr:DUF302 domain-containing protein [Thiobacillus sp.]MDP3585680.1 DUF302 domain-containing protein [Thiobacillus sp.]
MHDRFLATVGLVLATLLLPVPAASAATAAPKAQTTAQTTAQSSVYKMKLKPGVSLSEAADSMRLRANALNLQLVAELPMSQQVEAVTGKPQRTIIIFQFCDAVLARDLIEVNMDFSIYMPCRIALIEDASGQGWLVMMDVSIDAVAQEKRLPPALKERITAVRNALINIMQAGARGDL